MIKGSEVLLGGRGWTFNGVRWTFNGVGSRPHVTVAGIGDRAICNSFARKLDTRIFLVSRADTGRLRLNSSLVRISLSNIERTEAAVNGNFLTYLNSFSATKFPAVTGVEVKVKVKVEHLL